VLGRAAPVPLKSGLEDQSANLTYTGGHVLNQKPHFVTILPHFVTMVTIPSFWCLVLSPTM
jgi:hypothetical protein